MSEQIINYGTSEEGMRTDTKSIKVQNRKERKTGIAFLVSKAQNIACMDDRQLADLLMVNEEEITNVHYLNNHEISTNLLFRLHYATMWLIEGTLLDKNEKKTIRTLKKACYKEISKRNNWR